MNICYSKSRVQTRVDIEKFESNSNVKANCDNDDESMKSIKNDFSDFGETENGDALEIVKEEIVSDIEHDSSYDFYS